MFWYAMHAWIWNICLDIECMLWYGMHVKTSKCIYASYVWYKWYDNYMLPWIKIKCECMLMCNVW